jgi:hypothetical protein
MKTPPLRVALGKRLLKSIGPGVVTGAADDDPSEIATDAIVGAQLGTQLLLNAFFTWPLMGFVQMMCAWIGIPAGLFVAPIGFGIIWATVALESLTFSRPRTPRLFFAPSLEISLRP